jgi:enoyl-CoA hydratase/carnithine racemase
VAPTLAEDCVLLLWITLLSPILRAHPPGLSSAQIEDGRLTLTFSAAELDATTKALAGKLAGKSLAILALGRRSFFTAEDLPLGQSLEFLAGQLSLNVLTDDTAEGVTAFLEKRPAKWADR